MALPEFILNGYKDWKENNYPKNSKLHERLADLGQKPKAMIISCCDSRVDPNTIFKAQIGDFFTHKNIANIVPPYATYKSNYGTFSALEYGITALKIPNIIVLGHSCCGGIKYAYQKFTNQLLENNNSFVDEWVNYVKPAYDILDKNQSYDNIIKSLEKNNITNSIKNLLQFPFINNLILQNKLKIHGLWFEISSGDLMYYDEKTTDFKKIIL